MTSRNLILVGAAALTFGLSAATLAVAGQPQGAFTYRTAPPPSNPHDVFRTIVKVPATPDATGRVRVAQCDCAMMRGDAAARADCMGDHQGSLERPKA